MATYAIMLPFSFAAAVIAWSAPPSSFWLDSLLGGTLDALGNLAMLAALRATDLSVFGPLNAIRPILALLFGWMFLNESPTGPGMFGILITAVGTVIVLKEDGPAKKSLKAIAWRLLGFALSTTASVFLKRASLAVSAEMTLAGWIFCGSICLLIYGLARKESLFPSEERACLISHAAAFLVMQWLTIKIFQATLLSYAFVFFQLGMILQVIAGKYFFDEPHFARRMLGCVVMGAGAALILLRG